MKKLFFRVTTIVSFFLLVIWGCQKEQLKEATTENDKDATSMSVAEAKSWFETNQQPLMTFKAGKIEDKKAVVIKPNWNNAFKSKNSKYEVVETEILSQGGFGFATKESFDVYSLAKKEDYLTSLSRLVVLKNKETKNRVSFIMTIVGDKNFLEKKKFKINDTYLKRDNELSGYVLYHNLNGDFVNGWNYKEGKIKGKISISDASLPALSLKNFLKDEAIIYEWFEVTVTSYFLSGGRIGTSSYSYVYAVAVGVISYGSNGDGGGSDEAGGYNPASLAPVPCYCTNTCPVCGGCRDNLKRAGVDACAICTCPVAPFPVVDALDLLNEQKADCVYKRLTETGLMKRYLQNFDGDFPVSHLKYELNTKLFDNENGRTDPKPSDLGVYWMKIMINRNTLADRPTLGLAKTFIHETIHAEMYRKIISVAVNSTINPNDFPGLFDYYSRFINGPTSQHNLMAQHYIDIMASALKEFDPSYSDDVYNAIA